GPVRRRRRIVASDRYQHRELASPCGVGVVGKGSIVGGDDVGAERADAAALDDATDVEAWRLLRVAPPSVEGGTGVVVAGGQEGVGGDHAREAVGHVGNQAQPDQPAPVLADQGDVVEVQGVDGGAHPVDVALIGVVLAVGGLVAAAEADQVGSDSAVPGGGEHRDHGA